MKTVFATVGTTSFDELIESVTSSEAAQVLKARGYERLVLQVGRGSVFPATDSCPHIKLEAFRFKDSIAEDIKQADLVISHAGVEFGSLVPVKGTLNASAYQDILDNVMLPTLWEKFGDGPFLFQHDCAPLHKAGAGSCLEALGAGKPLLVVVNDKLMDNHQLELARQLHMDSHLLYCTCSTLTETLRTMDLSVLQPFPPGQPKNFADFLDKALGVK